MPARRGQWSAIRSLPNRPQRSITAPIASCPAIRIPTVAVTPMRGPAYVIENTMTSPITPPSSIHHGWWTARSKPARLARARRRITTAIPAVRAVENASASSTPMRSPSRDINATWIDPASPAATANTDASALPDTAERYPRSESTSASQVSAS